MNIGDERVKISGRVERVDLENGRYVVKVATGQQIKLLSVKYLGKHIVNLMLSEKLYARLLERVSDPEDYMLTVVGIVDYQNKIVEVEALAF